MDATEVTVYTEQQRGGESEAVGNSEQNCFDL